jgi:predicted AlkP superfamily phosphohydrolase/phosphomutase
MIISLDGASFDVLNPLVQHGVMPNVARLMQQGIATPLESTTPPITPVAWASFMTGKTPRKHGVFDFRLYDPNTQSDTFANAASIRARTLWQLLSDNGVRVGVVNLPMTYPPYGVNGFVVSGFDSPSLDSPFTHPASIRDDLLSRFPEYDFVTWPPADLHASDTQFMSFTEAVQRQFRVRTEAALHLAREYAPDVFMVHYQSTDALQHQLWCYMDPGLVETQSPVRREAVVNCYSVLDECLGMLLQRVGGQNTNVLVVSDHGFGPAFGYLYPNVWLKQWGYLHTRSSPLASACTRIKDYLRNSRITITRLLCRAPVTMKPLAPQRSPTSQEHANSGLTWIESVQRTTLDDELPLDWSRTTALVASAELSGLLYLHGVEEHAERQRLLAELQIRFQELVDPLENVPWFTEVVPGEMACAARASVPTPDLVLVPRPGWAVSRRLPHNHGVWRANRPCWGTHRLDGILIAAGPGIRVGDIGHPLLVDIAPTILHLLGLPVPADMDGQVLRDLLSVKSPVVYVGCDPTREGKPSGLSASEEATIEDRLRSLGYLG